MSFVYHMHSYCFFKSFWIQSRRHVFIIFLAMFSHYSFPVCLVSWFPLMRHGFHFSWFRISTTSSIFFLLCLKKAKEVLMDHEAALTPGIQNFLRPQMQLMPGGFIPSAETHIFPPCPPK